MNDSSFIIEELRVAAVGDATFGSDLTNGAALFPDEIIDIILDCDIYDVLFIDELGLECVVSGVDVCFDATMFRINDALLENCEFVAR